MKRIFLLLLLIPYFGMSQTKDQVKELVINNFIGLSKDSILHKFPDGLNNDTLGGVKYDIIRGRINKILTTSVFDLSKNKQHCFYYKMLIMTTYISPSDISGILNSNFKKDKSKWIQYKENDTITWSYKEAQYIVTLEAQRK